MLRFAALASFAAAGVCTAAVAAPADGVPRLGLFGPALHSGLCSNQHVSQGSRQGPRPEVQTVLRRFLRGQTSDYADMSPGMAQVVQDYVRKERGAPYAPLPWSAQSGPAQVVGVDQAGDDVYLIHRKGGIDHWNIAVNREGKIEAAYLCDGPEGLVRYDRYNAPYERGPGDKP